jgi:predicted nuclease of predicted toxin-antitoxin system
MKLLVDMNLSPWWVEFLSEAGFETVHWSDVGKPSAPDSEILDYAAQNKFVIFTHDLDFGALLAARQVHQPSVIQIRTQDVLPAAIGAVVVRALRVSCAQLETGALVTVDLHRNRIRLLPI